MNVTVSITQVALGFAFVSAVGFASGWISCSCQRLIRSPDGDRS